MQYYLLTQTDFDSFIQEANYLLLKGFNPVGGISITVIKSKIGKDVQNADTYLYAQAFLGNLSRLTKT